MQTRVKQFFKVFLFAAFLTCFLFSGFFGKAQIFDRKIIWNQPVHLELPGEEVRQILTFMGSVTKEGLGTLPVFYETSILPSNAGNVKSAHLLMAVYEPLTPEELSAVAPIDRIPDSIRVSCSKGDQQKRPCLEVSFLPLRRNPATGIFEKVTSFILSVEMENRPAACPENASPAYASHSVLATGNWYKMSLGANGIYKIGYADLLKSGLNVATIDPRNIRIYGNGGGMLPEANSMPRADDLIENSIMVIGEEDGRFDEGDCILFYGQSPDRWTFNQKDLGFHHIKNLYSDRTCYFLTTDLGPGKRVTTEPSVTVPATNSFNRFDDFAFYEKDDINLIKSGKQWFDQQYFDVTTTRNYSFSFPNVDAASPVRIYANLAARSFSGSTSFAVLGNGQSLMNIVIPPTTDYYLDTFAHTGDGVGSLNTANPVIEVKLVYSRHSQNAIGYLNYLELNAVRLLKMAGSQMNFRALNSVGKSRISEFTLTPNGQPITIWDVSHGGDVRQIETRLSGNDYIFRVPTDSLREFIAFDGSIYYSPDWIGKIPNQDLHGAEIADYLIVTHPAFIQEAEQLAAFHRQNSNLSVLVTTPDLIYNEFSSGVQDISAIRDFVRMMFNRAEPGNEPKYLLLFGDGSYDYKNRVQNNTNIVPTFESIESLDPVESYVSDDFFVLLGQNEGQNASGSLDMGVGRFPVTNIQEAKEAVNKVFHYCSNSDSVKNDWRNLICLVADDQDQGGNLFIGYSEDLEDLIVQENSVYNFDKIYLDAYTQVSTPGGARYPEVNEAINKRVGKGALIVNYIGHGGEVGWSHERVLEVPDIRNWKNFDNLPVFVTATCEFTRFDDPERVSAGEWVFLNPRGGGIALFTTTRATYASTNQTLLENFYANTFKKIDGEYYKMGDLILLSKNPTGSGPSTRKFVLLGDPALEMTYPKLNVVTTSINSNTNVSLPDTLQALSEVTIGGEVQNVDGERATGFNGTLFSTVYDKASEIFTKGQDGSPPVKFYLRNNPIYKGKVSIENGLFSFTFIVPKDIAIKYGIGRISYYARDPETDANGMDETIVVGGYNNEALIDENGPEVKLFMNDRKFISGGITNQNPVLIADVIDESGINTVGNGIGHDITAILDGKTTEPYILNDYYVADLNTVKSGYISYPLSTLSDGTHQLSLKVWDVYNNSSEAGIEFVVVPSAEFALQHLLTYPNPFQDHTTFSFETNQSNTSMEVEIRIYNLYGGLLKTIRQTLYSNGYRVEPVTWNGTSDYGWKIDSGTYVYKLTLLLPDGSTCHKTSKLVIIR